MTINLNNNRKRPFTDTDDFEPMTKRLATDKELAPKEIDQKVTTIVEDLLKNLESKGVSFTSNNSMMRKLVCNYLSDRIRHFAAQSQLLNGRIIFLREAFQTLTDTYRGRVETVALGVLNEFSKYSINQIDKHWSTLLEKYKERTVLREILRFQQLFSPLISLSLSQIFKTSIQLRLWLLDDKYNELNTVELMIDNTTKPWFDLLEIRLRPYVSVINRQEGKILSIFPLQDFSNILLDYLKEAIKIESLPTNSMLGEWLQAQVDEAFHWLITKVLWEYIKEDHEQEIHHSGGHCLGVTLATALNMNSATAAFLQEFYMLKGRLEEYYDDGLNKLGRQIVATADLLPRITKCLASTDLVPRYGIESGLYNGMNHPNPMKLVGRLSFSIGSQNQEQKEWLERPLARKLDTLISQDETIAYIQRNIIQAILLGGDILKHQDKFTDFLAGEDVSPKRYPASAYVEAATVLSNRFHENFSFLNFLASFDIARVDILTATQIDKLRKLFGLTHNWQLFRLGTRSEIKRIGLLYFDIGMKAARLLKTKPKNPSQEYLRLEAFKRECKERHRISDVLYKNYGLNPSQIVFAGEPLKNLHTLLLEAHRQIPVKPNVKQHFELILGGNGSVRHSQYISFSQLLFIDPNLRDVVSGLPLKKTFNSIEDLIEHVVFFIALNYDYYIDASLNYLEESTSFDFRCEKELKNLLGQRKELIKNIESVQTKILEHKRFVDREYVCKKREQILHAWTGKIQNLEELLRSHFLKLNAIDLNLSPYLQWKLDSLSIKKANILINNDISRKMAWILIDSVKKIESTYEKIKAQFNKS